MGNSGFEEWAALRLESVPLVESSGVGLRMQDDLPNAALGGDCEQFAQQRIAHSAASPGRHHRHPADMAVRQQPSGPDRHARGFGEHMGGGFIHAVPLQLEGNALLSDEHVLAHLPEPFAIVAPACLAERERA